MQPFRLIVPLATALLMAGCSSVASDTSSAPTSPAPSSPELDAAVDRYERFVSREVDALVVATDRFAAAFAAGDDDAARAQYASARIHWERIEPVAGSFGDLDPRLDLREAGLEQGQEWTGWHRIEKDLWPPAGHVPADPVERRHLAELLVTDTAELDAMTDTLELTALDLGDGAKALLDEIANGKVTGEEEIWSHTDLWDFQANLDGARVAYRSLRPVLAERDTSLASTLDLRFAQAQRALDEHRKGDGFVSYDTLTEDEVQQLVVVVDALAEPLSMLSSAVS
jgi:iron uptake system component EfeO